MVWTTHRLTNNPRMGMTLCRREAQALTMHVRQVPTYGEGKESSETQTRRRCITPVSRKEGSLNQPQPDRCKLSSWLIITMIININPVRVWVSPHIMRISLLFQLPVKHRHRETSNIQICPGLDISITSRFYQLLPSFFTPPISQFSQTFFHEGFHLNAT